MSPAVVPPPLNSKTIRLPSGVKTGFSWELAKGVRLRLSVPSAFISQMSSPVFAAGWMLLLNTISFPSGENDGSRSAEGAFQQLVGQVDGVRAVRVRHQDVEVAVGIALHATLPLAPTGKAASLRPALVASTIAAMATSASRPITVRSKGPIRTG